MARKTITVKIEQAGRDKGKVYLLTEMPASKAEKWATRAFLALARSGVEIPEDVQASGMAGIASLGFQMLGRVEFADAEVLMDEMFGCVQVVPDPKADFARALVEDDIDEVATRVKLRAEVFALHTGFSLADAASILTSAPAKQDSLTTETSRAP